MPNLKFKDNELMVIDIARKKGKLELSDISDIWDFPLVTDADRNRCYRKISRLLALEILAKTQARIIYVNKRNIPEGCFNLEWQETLG